MVVKKSVFLLNVLFLKFLNGHESLLPAAHLPEMPKAKGFQ